MQERYHFTEIEENGRRNGKRTRFIMSRKIQRKKSIIAWRCFLIPPEIYIWDMYGIILLGRGCSFKSMRGYNVLHPMGWDAFGLLRDAAIKNSIPPAKWTLENIENMRRQLNLWG